MNATCPVTDDPSDQSLTGRRWDGLRLDRKQTQGERQMIETGCIGVAGMTLI